MSKQRRVTEGEWVLEEAERMLATANACVESAHALIETNLDMMHPALNQLEHLGDEIDVVHAAIDQELRRMRRPTVVPIRGLELVTTDHKRSTP